MEEPRKDERSNGNNVEEVRKKLMLVEEVTKSDALDLPAKMKLATGLAKELLRAALDQCQMQELFPGEALLEVALNEERAADFASRRKLDEGRSVGEVLRLRNEGNSRWMYVVTGRPENELAEIYNYLRLVRIPNMAVRILQEMEAESEIKVLALAPEQRVQYNELRSLAEMVLENAVDTVGMERLAPLMKVEVRELQACLKKRKK